MAKLKQSMPSDFFITIKFAEQKNWFGKKAQVATRPFHPSYSHLSIF